MLRCLLIPPFPFQIHYRYVRPRQWFLLRIYSLRTPSYPRHRLFPLFLTLPVLVPGDSDQDLVPTLSRDAAGLAALDYDYPIVIVGLEFNLILSYRDI